MSCVSGSTSTGSLGSGSSEEDRSEEYIFNEDHFSSCSSLELEDIQEAILGITRTILETEQQTEERKELVHKLIRLRIKKEDLDNRRYFLLPGEVESSYHALLPAEPAFLPGLPSYCQECGGGVWPLLQTVYWCKVCTHTLHGSCLPSLRRLCVGSFLSSLPGEDLVSPYNGSITTDICPEVSLAEQDYHCAECSAPLCGGAPVCDYTGLSYCCRCHWGRMSPSPARVIHSWDFTPRPMCEASLQYLAILNNRPLLDLGRLAPGLTAVMEEVGAVVKQRQELLAMKRYLEVCRLARQEKLLTKLRDRQHFVDNAHMFSFQDLKDLHSGQLSSYLSSILVTFRSHIEGCVLCKAKSFVCEVCLDKETLFPFSSMVEVCPHCEAVFHRDCFRSVSSCPRCERKKEMKERRSSPISTED